MTTPIKYTLLSLCAFVLAACGGGGGGSAPLSASMNTGTVVRAGYAVDDYVIGGTVTIYRNGTNTVLQTTQTADYGKFTWTSQVTGVVRIEISGGVEDVDGLSATTTDQTPFARTITLLVNADTLGTPVVISPITTGLEQYAAGDLQKYNAAIDALDPSLRRLVVVSDVSTNETQIISRLETIKSTTRNVGFDALVGELKDDGTINQSTGLLTQQLVSVAGAGASSVQGAITVIQDAALRICIANAVEKTPENVTASDLTGLLDLNCTGDGVTSVAGIDALTHLESFTSTDSDISDIAPFANIATLGALSVANNRVRSIAPLLNGRFSKLQLAISNNCVTDIPRLASTTNIVAQGYGNPNQQYSTCVKNDASVYIFVPSITVVTKAYTVLYKASYNPAAICAVDWGDGQTSSASCDALAHNVQHAYASAPTNPVKFLVNGVVKKVASFPSLPATGGIQVRPIAFQQVNSSPVVYQTGVVAYIPISTSYDRATVQGLGITGVANLTDTGAASTLQVQNLDGSLTGDVIAFSSTLTAGAVPAGTAYTIKLYKANVLVSSQVIAIAGAVLSPAELSPGMFPAFTRTTYAALCPNGQATTLPYYTVPVSLPSAPQASLQCTSTSVRAEVESGDSLGRRFDAVFNLDVNGGGSNSGSALVLGNPTAGLVSVKSLAVTNTGAAYDTVQWTAGNFSATVTVFATHDDPALYASGLATTFVAGNYYAGLGTSANANANTVPMTYTMPGSGTSVWAVLVDDTNHSHWGYVQLR